YAGLVQASNTRSRGASNRRWPMMTFGSCFRSRLTSSNTLRSFSLCSAPLLPLLRLQLLQISVEPVEAFLPKFPVILEPAVDILEGAWRDFAGSHLRVSRACDQPRPLQHFEMLGDRGHGHVEGLGELRY